MGAEREAVLEKIGGEKTRVRALLETAELIFRAPTPTKLANKKFTTLIVKFSELANLTAKDGVISFSTKNKEKYALHLGDPFAARWLEKIKKPKGLFEKLGIKTGSHVALLGHVDQAGAAFDEELAARRDVVVAKSPQKQADLTLFFVDSKSDLKMLVGANGLAKKLVAHASSNDGKTGSGIWIVYPKGKSDPRELDVITAGRAAGMKDVKVASFSATHTALKFVAPKS